MERIITGHEAIAYADAHPGVTLQKYADPEEGARACHSVAEARDIAREDPSLIWLAVDVTRVTDEHPEDLDALARRALEAAGYSVHDRNPGPGICIVDLAPDSEGGSTEPGSAWDEECDARLAAVRRIVRPLGCEADWSDNDAVIGVA